MSAAYRPGIRNIATRAVPTSCSVTILPDAARDPNARSPLSQAEHRHVDALLSGSRHRWQVKRPSVVQATTR